MFTKSRNRQTVSLLAFAALVALARPTAAPAQTTMDWDKQTYRTALTLKALPGQAAALAEFYKTGPGAKTVQARLKDNPKLQSWSLLRNVYPGDAGVEVDHLISVTTSGAPSEPNPELNQRIAREAAGMSYADYMARVRSMTNQVGQILSHIHHMTAAAPIAEGDYVVVRRLKTRENQAQALYALARERMLPLAEEQVKAGGTFKAWSFAHVSFPTGESTSFDATESRAFKDLASAVASTGGAGSSAATRFAKKFPDQSYTAYIDSFRGAAKIVRTEVYRVVAVYNR